MSMFHLTTRQILSVCMMVLGGAASACACCTYKLNWSQDPAPCSGLWTQYCEESSPSCTQDANKPDVSCMITGPTRKAQCYTITGGILIEFCKCACNQYPGPGWILVGKLPDGSCCFVKNYTHIEPTVLEFEVNTCDTYCEPVPH